MRNAETVLGIIRERGRRGLPLEDVYRQLYNPTLYLRAYTRLYANKGAMTAGATRETVDGMSLAKIEQLISDLRDERYQWTPVRRMYIPKRGGKVRPLGIPTWRDKLLQEVMRSILEAYFEPQFNDHSHGFRPVRGCHTALLEIARCWTGTIWFIEGDISQCFDTLDHEVLLSILRENIHDNRFTRLIQHLLKAGYLEDWRYRETLSGCPQGGVISPILSNIYLDRLDKFVEHTLIPAYNRGQEKHYSKRYCALKTRARKRRLAGRMAEAKALFDELRRMPSRDSHDPNYRRLRYVRYADDFLLGFIGPKAEAEEVKRLLGEFLRDELKLELSTQKTLITHARTEKARFLGYDILSQYCQDRHDHRGRRTINGIISLRMPMAVVKEKRNLYLWKGKPAARIKIIADDDFTIISNYQAELRGIAQYYKLATNVSWLWRLHWVMESSLLRTLARKHQSSVRKMARKYKRTITTSVGTMKCLEMVIEREGKRPLVARFGGIPLRREKKAVLKDLNPFTSRVGGGTELLQRLLADQCELCGSEDNCEVHHIRKLADLKVKGRREKPFWVKRMAERRRKTLVACRKCHDAIHAGKALFVGQTEEFTGEPDALKGARPVRWGADRKGL